MYLASMGSGNLQKTLVEKYRATKALEMSNFRQKYVRKQILTKYGMMLKYELDQVRILFNGGFLNIWHLILSFFTQMYLNISRNIFYLARQLLLQRSDYYFQVSDHVVLATSLQVSRIHGNIINVAVNILDIAPSPIKQHLMVPNRTTNIFCDDAQGRCFGPCLNSLACL